MGLATPCLHLLVRKAGRTTELIESIIRVVKYDALSIKRHSFWLDLKLIALSFWIAFRDTWEHRGKTF